MPVVTKESDLFAADQDPAKARGRPIVTTFTVANAADDTNGSKFLLANVPSCAILDSRTAFQVQSWGYAAIRIGTEDDVDALVAVLRSAGNVVNPVAFADARHGLPLWQALGLADDPGGDIGLWAHAIADPTAAGTMRGEIHYRFR